MVTLRIKLSIWWRLIDCLSKTNIYQIVNNFIIIQSLDNIQIWWRVPPPSILNLIQGLFPRDLQEIFFSLMIDWSSYFAFSNFSCGTLSPPWLWSTFSSFSLPRFPSTKTLRTETLYLKEEVLVTIMTRGLAVTTDISLGPPSPFVSDTEARPDKTEAEQGLNKLVYVFSS